MIRNTDKQPSNADKKEEMKMNYGALEQKDRFIRRQLDTIIEMRKQRRRTKKVVEKMKFKIAALAKLLEEKNRQGSENTNRE